MKFLVATDGSDASARALDHAFEIADEVGARLTVVHAVDPSVYDRGGDEPVTTRGEADQRLVMESIEDAEARGFDILDEATAQAEERGREVETVLLYGEPVRQIVEYAADDDFDGIFMGHQGRSARAGRMLGSVAKTVVERADVPVTVVR